MRHEDRKVVKLKPKSVDELLAVKDDEIQLIEGSLKVESNFDEVLKKMKANKE